MSDFPLRQSVFVVLILVQMIFALWPILIKTALEDGDKAIVIALLRDAIASTCLWICVWFEYGCPNVKSIIRFLIKNPPALEHHDTKLFLLLGFASTVNSMCFVTSLKYVTPFNSALIHPSIPVFAVVLGWYLGVEPLSKYKLGGAAACVIGSIIVVFSRSDFELSYSLIGNVLLILQSFAMAVLLVCTKFVRTELSALTVTAVYYSLGTSLSIPLCSFLAIIDNSPLRLSSVESFLVVLFGAFFVVVLNFVALTWADRATTPTIPASSMLLQPPLTYFLTYLWGFKQSVGIFDVVGGLAIMAGLLTTVFSDILFNDEDSKIVRIGHDAYSDLISSKLSKRSAYWDFSQSSFEVPNMTSDSTGSLFHWNLGSSYKAAGDEYSIPHISDEELDLMLNHKDKDKDTSDIRSIDSDETFQI